MRFLVRTGAGTFCAAMLSILLTTTALGAGSHRPDGWVRFEGFHSYDGYNYPNPGPWKGKDVYNTTAVNQTAMHKFIGSFLAGESFYFTVTIQNDGATDRFKVKGGGGSHTKYFKGSSNITSAVKAGTYQTATLAAGTSTTIIVRIVPNYAETVLVTLTSVGDSTKRDAVKAGLSGSCGC